MLKFNINNDFLLENRSARQKTKFQRLAPFTILFLFIQLLLFIIISKKSTMNKSIKEREKKIHETASTLSILEKIIMGIETQIEKTTQNNSLKEANITSLSSELKQKQAELSSISDKINKNIISDIYEEAQILNWLPSSRSKSLTLVYKSSIDGSLPQDFYNKLYSYRNKVMVIETTKGHRFGGYTEVRFDYNKDCFITDENAFLFNIDTLTKFKVNTPNKAIYINNKNEFPSFGDDDIFIHWDLFGNKHYSNFPKYYGDKESDTVNMLTGGERQFEIKDIEVYLVKYD